MPNRQFHRRLLEVEKFRVERRGQMVFRDALPRLAAEVIHDLQVDLVGRRPVLGRPTRIQSGHEVSGDLNGESVIPAFIEPRGITLIVMVVPELRIQLAVSGKAAEREIARPHDGHDRVRGVRRTVGQIELRMERMPQMELHADLALAQLPPERPQGLFVRRRRNAKRQLAAEVVRDLPPPFSDTFGIDGRTVKPVHLADDLRRRTMHADKEPADAANGRFAALPVHLEDLTAGEVFHIRRDLLPAAQIEVSRAEVSPLDPGIRQDRVQPFLKLLIRVVENPCHRPPAPRRPVRQTRTCGGKNSACLVQDISLGAPLRARSRNTKNGHAERAY